MDECIIISPKLGSKSVVRKSSTLLVKRNKDKSSFFNGGSKIEEVKICPEIRNRSQTTTSRKESKKQFIVDKIVNSDEVIFSISPRKDLKSSVSTPSVTELSSDEEMTEEEDLLLFREPDIKMAIKNPPDRIVAILNNDLNILKIHEAICIKMASDKANLPILRSQLRKEKEKLKFSKDGHLDGGRLTVNEARKVQDDINRIFRQIEDIENSASWYDYIKVAGPLLKEYPRVASEEMKGIINVKINKTEKITEEPSLIYKRLNIINRYIEIIRNYIRVDIVYNTFNEAFCPGCGTSVSKTLTDEDLGLCTCECGFQRDNLSKISFYKDSSRVNIGSRNNYEDRDNFLKALYRHQGKQQDKTTRRLYSQLDEYALKINKPQGDYFRGLECLPDGTKAGTSHSLMLEMLEGTGNSAFYEDKNLICHKYWGWKLPDLEALMPQIMDDYDRTQKVYESIPNKPREASLNTQIRLYFHLKAVDFPCTRDEFKIPTDRDSLVFHQWAWEIMCAKTGVKFVPLI